MTAALEALILCERYYPWRLKPMPEEAVTNSETSEDLSDEYEPEPYTDGYELPRPESGMAEQEN